MRPLTGRSPGTTRSFILSAKHAGMFCLAFVCASSLLQANLLAAERDSRASARPNILWLIAEDFGPELSCYGHPQVWTPRIDSLADRGMRFTQTFTVTPVCSTSRSSFMTGMYAMSIGAHNHRSHRNDGFALPDGVRVLTDRFRDAGYFTANVRHFPKSIPFKGTGKTDWNFHYEGKPFDSDQWDDLRDHQPFYAQVNFPETHRGRDWDKAHIGLERTADPEKVNLPPYYPDHPIAREDWAQYLNAAMTLDRKIGMILELMKEQGLDKNTVVFFMGDHGRAHVRGKQWPYDSGLHVPFIVAWPAGIPVAAGFQAGTVSDRLVSSLDWSATSLAIAGIDVPPTMQGETFLGENAPPPREYLFGGRDRGDETVLRIRTVRTDRYRYIRNFMPERPFLQINRYKEVSYPMIPLMRKLHALGRLTAEQEVLMAASRPAEELFDVTEDPYEIHNLASDPQYADVKAKLAQRLEEWIVDIDDKGRIPEPQEVIDFWEQRQQQNYADRLQKTKDRFEELWQRKYADEPPSKK